MCYVKERIVWSSSWMFCVQEQYRYLYEMAIEYMESFDTYANFK